MQVLRDNLGQSVVSIDSDGHWGRFAGWTASLVDAIYRYIDTQRSMPWEKSG